MSIDASQWTGTVFRVVRRHPDAKLPTRARPDDAGWDLYAAEAAGLRPGDRKVVDLGFALQVHPGWEVQIRPRSGQAARNGVTVLNTPGTVDAGFIGTMKVLLINHGQETFRVEPGDRIAQAVFQRIPPVEVAWGTEEDLGQTVRGQGGWGSSG